MGRLVKILLFLVVLNMIVLIGYSYLGDLSSPNTEITHPVTTNE
jgi:hypothetical protein